MQTYSSLVKAVLWDGEDRPNRTGMSTRTLFNVSYCHDLATGFPLLTTKRISWKNIVVELLWFLSGDQHIEFLHRHGCKFWDPWVDEHGYVPSAYGKYWRRFPSTQGPMDQLRCAVETLTKDPYSRRAVISAWEPGNALTSPLPPCHAFFVLTTHGERLNLHLTQRSCDVGLGLPYNLASYSLLVHLLARFLKRRPGTFAHSIVDAHVYENHVQGITEQITRKPRPLPTVEITQELTSWDDLNKLYDLPTEELMRRFPLTGYKPYKSVQLPVAV